MNRVKLLGITLAMLCVGIALTMSNAMAQGVSKIDKTKIVGSWTVVSATVTTADGKTIQTFGPNDGMAIFNANGTSVQVFVRSDLPKFASNNRNTGSPDENKAIVQNSLAFFGTYTVSDDGTLTLHIERCTFPNFNGTDQKRLITSLTADELKWHTPAASVGGTAELVWKRTK